jgi:hypothetical protein
MPSFAPVELTMAQNKQAVEDRAYIFPQDIGKYGTLLVFREYRFQERRDLIDRQPVPTIAGSILLPLPRNMLDNTGVQLNGTQLGITGEVIAKTLSQGGTSLEAMGNAAASLFPSGTQVANGIRDLIVSGGEGLSQDISTQLNFLGRRLLSSVGDPSAFNIGTGSIVNPKQALTFDGLQLKVHNLSWSLAPRTPGESEVLRQIVRTIKRHMLPAFQNLNAGGTSVIPRAFLKFPSMVDVFYLGFEEGHMYRFKTSMIASCEINYTPQGISILKGGKPAAIELNLALQETDIHVSADYGGEGDTTLNGVVVDPQPTGGAQ